MSANIATTDKNSFNLFPFADLSNSIKKNIFQRRSSVFKKFPEHVYFDLPRTSLTDFIIVHDYVLSFFNVKILDRVRNNYVKGGGFTLYITLV